MTASQRFDFSGRTAVVTGAGAGIGAAVAAAFGDAGARVVLADLDKDRVDEVRDRLREGGAEAISTATDVTSTADTVRLVDEAVTAFGTVDILVVSAGGYHASKLAEDIEDHEWDAAIAVNLTGAFKTARAAIPAMKEGGSGRIIMVSSASARMPTMTTKSVVHYSAAKAGMLAMTRKLALELGPSSITVNAVAPGTTVTERISRLRSEEALERIAQTVPLGRLATVDGQVGPILFLASDEARYIMGVTLDVNGGRLMM